MNHTFSRLASTSLIWMALLLVVSFDSLADISLADVSHVDSEVSETVGLEASKNNNVDSISASGKPAKLELGVAVGGQVLRDYRGSKNRQTQAYPVPYFIYRGDMFKADKSGVRAEFLSNDIFEFSVSGEASLNGGSEDNALREGMPALESAFEMGPSLNINLSGNNLVKGWMLRFPVRGVVTVGETGVHFIGYTFNPRLTYIQPDLFEHWHSKFSVGALYGSNKYHDYYYHVAEEYVTNTRPYYDAEEGFSGLYAKAGISRRIGSVWMGANIRYDNLKDTVFEDSPLVETKDYFALSFFISKTLWYSR